MPFKRLQITSIKADKIALHKQDDDFSIGIILNHETDRETFINVDITEKQALDLKKQVIEVRSDKDRYPLCKDQLAQIDCRKTECPFHEDGKCNNSSPAITLHHIGKFICWSRNILETEFKENEEYEICEYFRECERCEYYNDDCPFEGKMISFKQCQNLISKIKRILKESFKKETENIENILKFGKSISKIFTNLHNRITQLKFESKKAKYDKFKRNYAERIKELEKTLKMIDKELEWISNGS
jgi:hypothetical protein